MSQIHQNYFNAIRSLIRPWQQDGVRSLQLQCPARVLMRASNILGIQNSGQILQELGFTYRNGRLILLPHPFDIDMNYYERNIVAPLAADYSGRLSFATLVQRVGINGEIDAYLALFRHLPPSPIP